MTKLKVGLRTKITCVMMMTYFTQKLKEYNKILQTMSQEKEIAIGFILMFSENPNKILDNMHSPADVDQLIAERIEYAKSQKAADLAQDPHVNVNSTASKL